MKTINYNGHEFLIENNEGRVTVKQRNVNFPAMGAEWQTVGRCKIENGEIANRSGMLAMDDCAELEAKIVALA